jgi:hypothetical protein
MTARIKSAIPFPWIGAERIAYAPRNRPGVNVAVIDVPAVGALGVAAAGEGGHAALKRDRSGQAIVLRPKETPSEGWIGSNGASFPNGGSYYSALGPAPHLNATTGIRAPKSRSRDVAGAHDPADE